MTMTLAILGYFTITLSTLIALARMILQVGRTMGDCPTNGATARAAALAVTTGFVAIGMGGVILIAAIIPSVVHGGTPASAGVITLLTMGLACLSLGLGFSHAVRTLQAVLQTRPASALSPDKMSQSILA
jgi:hypothetical protein